jgi:hypothetical protein
MTHVVAAVTVVMCPVVYKTSEKVISDLHTLVCNIPWNEDMRDVSSTHPS